MKLKTELEDPGNLRVSFFPLEKLGREESNMTMKTWFLQEYPRYFDTDMMVLVT